MCPPSLCRIMRSCRGVAWLSRLHFPLVDPTWARVRTLLTSTLAARRCCHSGGLTPFPINYWPTWQKGQGQTCVLSAPTCSVSQGRDLPTTLQGRKPLCEHKHSVCGSRGVKSKVHPTMCNKGFIEQNTNKHVFTSTSMLSSPCAFSGLHLSGLNPCDILALTPHLHTLLTFYLSVVPSMFLPKLLLEKV